MRVSAVGVRSNAEEALAFQLRAVGIPTSWVREFAFDFLATGRKWRFDFAWPARKLAVEIDGGAFSGGRHTTGDGFRRDLEKSNAAVMAGWRVLHFLPEQVDDGSALALVERALHGGAK
jgi:very-short-patch-repair endonuclease